MALNSLLCAHVPLRNCSLTHSLVPNFIKIGQTVAVSRLTVFKMAAVCHLGFFFFKMAVEE